jgi:hypothetical protein
MLSKDCSLAGTAILLLAATAEITCPKVEERLYVGDEKRNFLSATLGDHMVLQRAPQQAYVWGYTAGATVTTAFNNQTFTAKTDVNGTWRQALPATEASGRTYMLTFKGSAGESASLNDVLFGDVFICRSIAH